MKSLFFKRQFVLYLPKMLLFTVVFRIQCYVSVLTEKDYLSFQLTYHSLTFDLVLELRKVLFTIFLSDFFLSQMYWFQHYLPVTSVAKKDLSFQRQ